MVNDQLIEIIKKAGEIALKEQSSLKIHKKPDGSIVSSGDLATSKFLEEELLKLYPDHSIYSEENYSVPKLSKVIVIDPIDGTESYVRKQYTWSILVGFINGNELIGGVVYQPSSGDLYFGEKGKGSFQEKNGIRTQLNAQGSGEIKGISSHKFYNGEKELFDKYQVNNLDKMYSAALKIMKVSSGEKDVYPNFRGKCSLWDLVAPWIILKEAGGDIEFEPNFKIDYLKPHLPMKWVALGKRTSHYKIS